MTTAVIIGAGPGLGAAAARRFGAQGFDVALVSRTQANVDALAEQLRDRGVTARGYAASVRDLDSLRTALRRAAGDLGPVEVVQYSPIPQREFLRPVLETDAADLRAAVEFSILGPQAVVSEVLPGMRTLGRGTLLFVNGGSGARPNPAVAGTSVAFAGESAYARMLHDVLADDGVHVGQLIVPGGIAVGHPTHDPDVLAGHLWRMHAERAGFRVFAEPMPDVV
ncbi:SDR family NAD(P)-dependent oxidoreductase [Quadrisphaera sp. INWT6]|uniref:SDR family NAD(P)-dependent oxidoreductase n=1 Tax=Quadrisphaera sp. INWT6 TaxID=2596917 RepID=UPI00189267A8|nr:SDR family NAD(P)-dependent oxidoreductase [Quadrisphaera sp. INWT6]MBF5083407.1 SDR family NAD(P)-dependent oxidoreductase [Quadrisphaera sp. INWT6]